MVIVILLLNVLREKKEGKTVAVLIGLLVKYLNSLSKNCFRSQKSSPEVDILQEVVCVC